MILILLSALIGGAIGSITALYWVLPYAVSQLSILIVKSHEDSIKLSDEQYKVYVNRTLSQIETELNKRRINVDIL